LSLLPDRSGQDLFCVGWPLGGTVLVTDVESALVVLRQAIHNEIAGQRFYGDAALHCIDPWAKEVFATLAEEEEGHTQLLLLEYEALTTQGRWIDLDAARTSDAMIDITRFSFAGDAFVEELFPQGQSVSGAVDRLSDDLAALAFGIEMEKKAIELYSRQAAESADPAAENAYEFLVQEETRHYDQLKTQWEKLAGASFVGNSSSPEKSVSG
jgi:rubrerythrin